MKARLSRKLLGALSLTAAAVAMPVHAEVRAQQMTIQISAASLKESINQLIAQTHQQILYSPHLVRGKHARSLSGAYTPEQALALLLEGSGLRSRRTPSGAYVLEADAPGPAASASAGQAIQADASETPEAAPAQDIVVTGSRVVHNGNSAPTPVTTIATDNLLATTPSNLAVALKTLPQFAGSTGQRNIGLSGANVSGNTLNLRNFGAQRNLILLDGTRVPPSTADGTVNIDNMPEMFVQRVDVVTGGASAVYGSDAVTGVVNYILDKKFNGIKFDANTGVSTFGDDDSWKFGIAAGTNIGSRGHIEVSYSHYNEKGIIGFDQRPHGSEIIIAAGDGSPAAPFKLFPDGRFVFGTRGSYILIGPPGAGGMVFKENGVPTPFVHGTPYGPFGFESGGDGGTLSDTTLYAPLRTDQAFGRFDYELTDHIKVYAQASYNRAHASYPTIPNFIVPAGPIATGTILSGNAFLPKSIQDAMTAAGAASINIGRANDPRDGYKPESTDSTVTTTLFKGGLEGKLGNYSWNMSYSRGKSRQNVINVGNINAEKQSAATDAVVDPATGKIVCYISLTPYASRFPGCVPFNPFGPTAPSHAAFDFMRDNTTSDLTNTLDDFNIGISGSPFSTWAGPVEVALSGEYRKTTLTNRSNAEPTALMNCNGLRANCGPTIPTYAQTMTASMHASENVKEVAAEILLPLLSDVPFFKKLDLSGAVRYTDYSVSGSVYTWKLGGSWELNNEIRVRAARSRDIRAPDLFALFSPVSTSPSGLVDIHTGTSSPVIVTSSGNPNLKPEIAQVWTAGVVYQPAWLPNFSLSVDYYNVKMSNAITTANGVDQLIQLQCEQSNGTSPYCSLYTRPLPFSDRTAANFPTVVYSRGLNAARQWTSGFDVEANYRFGLDKVAKSLPGDLALRLLFSAQPVFNTQTVAGGQIAHAAGVVGLSKYRADLRTTYTVDDLTVSTDVRWQSSVAPYDKTSVSYLVPNVPQIVYADMAVEYRLDMPGGEVRPYFSVRNIFNQIAPIVGGTPGNPGLVYAGATGYDIVGRYFTFGIRGKF